MLWCRKNESVSSLLHLIFCFAHSFSVFLSRSLSQQFYKLRASGSGDKCETVQSFVRTADVALWIAKLEFLKLEKEAVKEARQILFPSGSTGNGVVDLGPHLENSQEFKDACETMHRLLSNSVTEVFSDTCIRVTRCRLIHPTPDEIKNGCHQPTEAMWKLWKNKEWKKAAEVYLRCVQLALDEKFGKNKWTITRFGEFGPHVLRSTRKNKSQRAHLDAKRFFLSGLRG